ncbi:MAG: von Willebrand factor type A domain-containing protein, partial [Flavobacteriaceae bacterium]|nr:von Willebrand factor type A domain-containing protein [Flavobacteriaceae bacterium]
RRVLRRCMPALAAVRPPAVQDAQGAKRERKALGFATTMVEAESIQRTPNNNPTRLLSGSASGIQVSSQSGVSGSGANIVIRGVASANRTHQQPLYIVDGVPFNQNNVQNLTSKDIKNISILKDKSATSLYGNKGRNGVVVITTKKGNGYESMNESYKEIVENQFQTTQSSPLSTFSIDVDKASYSNIRRMINNGQKVPTDAVKIEEMINYFSYSYPQPTDDHPFSINTEVTKTPWNNKTKLVRIGLQGREYKQDELPASNLTFLIDVSGSMNSARKLGLLKSSFRLLVNQLREKDKVSIVVYAGAAGVVLEPTAGDQKEKILKALYNLEAGGSTAGGEGIQLAYQLAQKHFKKGGNNRVILATDGDFNVGASSDKDMQKLIEEQRKSGVFLSVLGFGYGNYKDAKLETLADKGNGNHAYIDTLQEAQKVFGKEFGGTLYTIAKDVKIQIEFNPQNVAAYRLIGYENRLLNDEDFVNDTIDAGELGIGHTVTALYEILPVGMESDAVNPMPELKYSQRITNEYKDELFTVKFRYKKPTKDTSVEMIHVAKNKVQEASEDMKFASAVALFGMQLRKSKFHNDSKINNVIALAKQGRGEDDQGYRSEFIRLVRSYQ